MQQVGLPFLPPRDRIPLGHRARTEASDLRKDEPHPVRAFAAVAQFLQYLLEDRRLRIDEALQMERV